MAAAGFDPLGAKLDEMHAKGNTASNGGIKATSSALKEAAELGARLRESLGGVGDAITERLRYPLPAGARRVPPTALIGLALLR